MSGLVINGRFLTQRTTGVQRYAAAMAAQLRARFPQAEIVHPPDVLDPGLARQLTSRPLGKSSGYLWEQMTLPRYLRSRSDRPVLINLANVGPLAYTNSLLVLHDVGFLRHPEWYSRRFAAGYRLMVPRLVKSYRRIVTDSEFSRQELLSCLMVPADKIAVVPCGVSEQFSPGPSSTESASRPYILAVSSLDPRKNLSRLIDAFMELNLTTHRLICVGGSHRAFAEHGQLVGEWGDRIEFTGHVTDEKLIDLYRGASLFVFPSLYEGFGLPPLEAMACGCPCVVARAGALQEVCGDAVVYCNPQDTGDIADAMRQVLGDQTRRDRLVEWGKARAGKFSWDVAGAKMVLEVERMMA